MARISIDLPDRFAFSTEMAVRIADINYGQHLGYDAMIGLLHESRVRFLAEHGLSEIDVGGCGLIMIDVALVFKAEVDHGASLLFEMTVRDLSKSSWDFVYRVVRSDNGQEVARAKAGFVCFDYARKKMCSIPESFKSLLKASSRQ